MGLLPLRDWRHYNAPELALSSGHRSETIDRWDDCIDATAFQPKSYAMPFGRCENTGDQRSHL